MNNKLKCGDRVIFSAHSDCIFMIITQHDDGSYTIEPEKGNAQIIRYDNVVKEMLRLYTIV